MPALMDDVVPWRIPSIPLVGSVCALLVAGSLSTPHKRASFCSAAPAFCCAIS